MRDEARIILNTVLALTTRVVSMATGIVMVPYLIGHLGEATYGVIGIAGSILGFMILVEMGIRPATVRQYTSFLFSGDERRANELVSTSLAFYGALGAAILLGLAVLGRDFLTTMQVSPEILDVAYWTLLATGVALVLNLLNTAYRAALVSHLRHDIQHYTELFNTLLRPAVIVLVFTLWVESLLVWGAASILAAAVIFFVTRRQSVRVSPTFEIRASLVSRRGWRDLSSFGVDTTLAQLSAWLNMQSGPVIISYYLGIAAVTHHTPVLVLMNALLALSASFLEPLVPVMTRAAAESNLGLMRRTLIRSIRYAILVSGAAAVWVGSLAELIVPSWLGEGFRDTQGVLVVWSASVVLRACTGAAFPVFLGTGKLRGIAIINMGLAALTVSISVYLVGYADLGILGIAIGVLVAQVFRTLVRVAYAARICGVGAYELAREAYVGAFVCLFLVGGCALGVQSWLDAGVWTELLASGLSSLAVFAVAAWTIGLNADDRAKAVRYARQGWQRLADILGRG